MSNFNFTKTILNGTKQYVDNIHSWNNLKDRPFYITEEKTEMGKRVEVLPETTLEFEIISEQGISVSEIDSALPFKSSSLYTVTIDEVVYENIECFSDSASAVALIGSQELTDYPFYIISIEPLGLTGLVMLGESTSHTISIVGAEIKYTPSEFNIESNYLQHFQSNWDEENEKKTTYIHNRPFHLEPEKTVIVPQFEYDFDGSYYREYFEIIDGKTYFVNFDGTEYECVGFEEDGDFYLGDSNYNDYPFAIRCYGNGSESRWRVMNYGLHTFEISTFVEHVVINDRYKNSLQSDWDVDDESSVSYVKNKPFYHKKGFATLIPETTVEIYDEYEMISPYTFEVGQTYTVTFNGEKYECVCWTDGDDTYLLGNGDVCGGNDVATGETGGNGEPFSIDSHPGGECYLNVYEAGTYTLKVEGNIDELKKIDDKFQHQANWNEMNGSKASYILNKPFGESFARGAFLEEINITNDTENFSNKMLVEGRTYFVICDGSEYECIARNDGYNAIYVGNQSLSDGWTFPETIESDEPFFIATCDGWSVIWFNDDETHTLSIDHLGEIVIDKIDTKYLPDHLQFGNLQRKEYVDVLSEEFVYSEEYYLVEHENFFEEGVLYKVNINGNIYESICFDGEYLTIADYINFFICYDDETNSVVFNFNPEFYPLETTINVTIQKQETVEYFEKIDPKYLPDNIGGVTSWNDLTDKPFGEEIGITKKVLLEETLSIDSDYLQFNSSMKFETGKTYTVTFNGDTYECVAWYNDNAYLLGNGDIYGGNDSATGNVGGNGEPFSIDSYNDKRCYLNVSEPGTYTVKISTYKEDIVVKKIDAKYQQSADWNENDETKGTYIANKPFGDIKECKYITLISENFDYYGYNYYPSITVELKVGETYRVTINESVKDIKCIDDNGMALLTDDETFYIVYNGGFYISLNPDAFENGTNVSFEIQLYQVREYIKKIDKKYLPDTANEGILLKDAVNGYEYIVEMRNGQLVSYCKIDTIEITSMPINTTYIGGGIFDTTGLVITATRQDGTVQGITNYTYNEEINEGDSVVIITYKEGGIEYTFEIPVTTTIDMLLIDFNYIKENDGTYTLTGWKGTLNGEPSTEIVIPNNEMINA